MPDAIADASVLGHLFAQSVCDQQLFAASRASGGIHVDLPVGVHPAGFDPWWYPESFANGASAGAPPDKFFSEGQTWGIAPMHPENARASSYSYVIEALRRSMRHASSLRIDHVMGLHRIYVVPEGMDARQGAYLRYRADELYAIVRLEAHLSGTVVVGEDLGTVPAMVRRRMARDQLLGSFVFEFSSTEEDPLPEPRSLSMASISTHDLSPFASFWRARRDLGPQEVRAWRAALRRGLFGGDRSGSEDVAADADEDDDADDDADQTTLRTLVGCLEYLSASPALMVLVDLEDLWLETEPQNRPGTGREARNFTRRCSRSLEEIENDPTLGEVLELVSAARKRA